MLHTGYHIGIGYDHDNHYTNFGRSNGGRLVVLMPALTRANLTQAMQQMHFYGSDDSNAKVEFTMNENIMGSVVSGNYYPEISVVHDDADGEQADTIRIWRGNKSSGGLWAQVMQTSLHSNTAAFTDNSVLQDKEYYYFAEIKQADGQWIVTSPIWYTRQIDVAVNESKKAMVFNYFPNPVSKKLNISFSEQGTFHVLITDLTGRRIYENTLKEKDVTIDLLDVQQGVYTLQVKARNGLVSKKLVVE